jgi:hypothetical protein
MRALRTRLASLVVCTLGLLPWTLAAQELSSGGAGSPASAPVWEQEEDGDIIVRATRIAGPLTIDGRLDERPYHEIPAITQFVQQEPHEGSPVSEKTEAWIFYDDENVYLSCRCWDSNPEAIVANDMRRDSPNINEHDSFGVQFDTFADGRGGFFFYVNPLGGSRDAITQDTRPNNDWNAVWNWNVGRFEGGWTAELAIPFKSLRYRPGRDQTWGIQIRRLIRSKNERVHLTLLSPAWGSGAWNHLSQAATLTQLQAPARSRNLELKPYVTSSLRTDRLDDPPVRNRLGSDAGFDVKYGITRGLTADFTYNTDFAQVEADEAQVNLTRFSLSFPEKREFFLEGAGIFDFGNVPGTAGDERAGSGNAPLIFYSRRIGLAGNRALPVLAGGRLTGRAGNWGIGAINIEVDDSPAAAALQTNFTVMRVQRKILQRSSIGGIFTRRSASTVAPGANDVFGFDASFGLSPHVNVGGYVAQSRTDGLDGDDTTYRAQFNYDADRYGLFLDRIVVEDNFNPEVGFMRRDDFRRNLVQARFSPRTPSNPLVRKWIYEGKFDYITDNDSRLESREAQGRFQLEFHNTDSIAVEVARLHESVPENTFIEDVHVPVGGYSFSRATFSYSAGQQHRVSGETSLDVGSFYGGTRQTAEFKGRVEVTPRLGIEPTVSLNWIDLPEERFTTTVTGGRTTFTVTPRMFVGALVQYSSASSTIASNVRVRWEYQPGSEHFVVYTEGRSTFPVGRTELQNRGVVVKVNRLFRF